MRVKREHEPGNITNKAKAGSYSKSSRVFAGKRLRTSSVAQDSSPGQEFASTSEYTDDESSIATNSHGIPKSSTSLTPWNALSRWFLAHTFTPSWLPSRLRYPVFGYLVAVLLQVIATFVTLSLVKLFPTYALTGLLQVLVIALMALNWGAGPSLVATLVGAAMLDYMLTPPLFARTFSGLTGFVEMLLFLIVGLAISVVASQVEQARRRTEELTSAQRRVERRTQDSLNALLAMAETLVLIPDERTSTGELTAAASHKVAQRLVALTCSVLGCQRVSITAVDPETHELRSIAVVGLSPEQEQQWRNRTSGFYLSDIFSGTSHSEKLNANEVLLLNMTQPPLSNHPNPFGIQIMLLAPMCIGDQLVGLLSIDHGGDEHQYTQEEIALARAVAKLAALVIERERLIRERAEARASELALREANRRMDEFIGMTSHELKTPLTSIKGNTQLVARQLRQSMQNLEKMEGMLESTDRQVRLLNRLVDDLLDLSRTQANQLELRPAVCDLIPIVRQAIEEQQQTWPTRTIILDQDEISSLPVAIDADRIGQVITNYLTNALKYSDNKKPVLVTVRRESADAYISIRDEGPGLSDEEQEHIWDRFYRAHEVEVRSNPHGSNTGLGLGLYISRIIVEQHLGRTGVSSILGEGSTFWFRLPLYSDI